jgi:hypothetical protein
MSFWANVFLGNCPSGQMSSGQMSFWANIFLGKRPSGQMSFWANVFLGKLLMGKRLMGKCPSGQMSFWANVFWADVFWANVVLGKCRVTLVYELLHGTCAYPTIYWNNLTDSVSFNNSNTHIQCVSLTLASAVQDLLRRTEAKGRF